MLLYSKLHALIVGKGKVNTPSFGLKCNIKNLFCIENKLRFVHFQTENNIDCLLNIDSSIEIKNDTDKKFSEIKKCLNPENNFNLILSQKDDEIKLMKKLKDFEFPQEFVELLKTLYSSLFLISFKASIITEEFLLVQNDESNIDVFQINNNSKNVCFLVSMDIKVLLDTSIFKIERAYLEMIKLLQENNEQYWKNLKDLLIKCQNIKIITQGKKNMDSSDIITKNAKLLISQKAINTALKCFENFL
jgi:hypothetical protein